MKDTIYRVDVLNVLRAFGWTPIDGLYLVVKQDIPSADSEVVGKLKAAIESEELCKSCPTAERISRENLLGAMALGFSYGMDADRPQGEWIKDNLGTVICSECKRPRRDNRINHINFCNSCGARMKGADDD